MANQLFAPSGKPLAGTLGNPQEMIDEFASIEDGFDILNVSHFLVTFNDLNTAGSRSFIAPFNGEITLVECINDVLNTTTATIVTLEIDGTTVKNGSATLSFTFGATAAAGTEVTGTPGSANTFDDGDRIEVITDGGGAPVMPGSVMVYCTRTA